MFQPVVGAGRLQVGKEQASQSLQQGRGAEQSDHGNPCSVIGDIMEKVKAGIQIEVAFLEAASALHQLQCRIHAFPDDERLDGGIRVVAEPAAHAGEDSPAGMIGEQRLYLQLRPVFPFHQCAACAEYGIDAFRGKQDAGGPGIVDLYCFRAKLLDLAGVVKGRQRHIIGWHRSGLCSRLEQRGLPVTEYFHTGFLQHGIGNGCLLEPEPPGNVATGAVGVGAAGEVEREAGGVFCQEELFPPARQPVSTQPVLIVGPDMALLLEPGDELFPIAGVQVQMGQHTGAALPGNGGHLHQMVRTG